MDIYKECESDQRRRKHNYLKTFSHNWNLAEVKMEQNDGLRIKQETVDDQNEICLMKEECILKWDDSWTYIHSV